MEEQKQTEQVSAEVREKEMDAINQKYEELLKELEDMGKIKDSYAPDSLLPLTGAQFTKFLNYVNEVGKMIEYIKSMTTNITKVLNEYHNSAENMELFNSAMVVNLMQVHLDFVKQGKSISDEEMDKVEAKSKIKLEK